MTINHYCHLPDYSLFRPQLDMVTASIPSTASYVPFRVLSSPTQNCGKKNIKFSSTLLTQYILYLNPFLCC